jgi:hypothetical protein
MPVETDLNAIRDKLLGHQRNNSGGQNNPLPATNAVVTTPEGQLKPKEDVQDGEQETVSEVPQDTLASSERLARDKIIVKKKLPRNTKFIKLANGAQGWKFVITSELKIEFEIFIYFDGAYYQAFCMAPHLDEDMKRGSESFSSEHDAHLYQDGRICMGDNYGAGWIDLSGAFGKCVLWANGVSVMILTGDPFPFNYNQ